MKRFKEIFTTNNNLKQDWSNNTMRLSDLGAVSFGTGVTDKNSERTPHYEINESMKMYEDIPIVNSALNQLTLFLIPNIDIHISSEDPKTVKFLEDWHMKRTGIIEEYKNILLTNLMCGNGYAERFFAETTDGKPVLDNVFSVNDASRIYVNPDSIDGSDAFVFELPIGIKSFKYMGKIQTPGFHNVQYIKNYTYMIKRVYGIVIPDFKMKPYATGWSRDNLYGRSMLISAVDASNVYKEILSSWDTIARTRQMDHKLLTIDNVENGVNIDQKKLDALGEQLENTDKSYTLFNVPLKFIQQDINVSGKYDLMEGVMDMLRRTIMMSLLPQHLTPWSDSATTQGSESAMPPFLGRLKSKQNEFIKYLNTIVIGELRKTYPFIAEDASFVFDEPKVMSTDYYVRQMTDLVNSGIITTQQARDYLIDLGVLDERVIEINNEEIIEPTNFPESPKNKKHSNITESALKANVKFDTFKKRLKDRDNKIDTTGWEEISHDDVGGKQIRLIKVKTDDKEIIMMFDGLTVIDNYDLNVVELKTIKQAYQDYKQKLIKMQDEFLSGNAPEDDLIDAFEVEMKSELDSQLDKVFKLIGKSGRKTEAFLSPNILGKIDGFFKNFSSNINKSINNVLNKLNIMVVDSKEDNVSVDDKIKKDLQDKRDLFKQNLKQQLTKNKDSMLTDIKTSLRNGIAAGKDVSDIKKEVEKQFNYEDGVGWKFKRAAVTGLRQANGILKLQKLKKAGFEEYIWQTMEDDKVRPDHAKRNQRVYKIQDALEGKMPFPGGSTNFSQYPNYNCRCRILPY